MNLNLGPAWLGLFALLQVAAKKVSVKEVVFDSAVADIQWRGADQKTVLVHTTKGRLYRSTNGGDGWNEMTSFKLTDGSDSGQIVVDNLVQSPADANTILVVGKAHDHYVSVDTGATWRKLQQKSTIHTFIFHKTRPKWAMLSTWTAACEARKGSKKASDDDDEGPCNHMLYLTKDMGKTFSLVSSYVVQFSWGNVAKNQQDRIYFTHFRDKKGDQPKLYMWSQHVDFSYTDDGGGRVRRMVKNGNKFLISNNFIFVAQLKDVTSQTVSLRVSNDGGSNFRLAKLPQEIDEKSYTILDTSEGAVMIHVNHGSVEKGGGSVSNVGHVYISDAEGVSFTLSLPNNVRSSTGECEFDKVLSLDGVYMANFKDDSGVSSDAMVQVPSGKKAESASQAAELEEEAAAGTEVDKRRNIKAKSKDESIIRSVITFDKGGVWSYLKPPKIDSLGKPIECPPDRCWLHLHGVTNFHNYAPFYSTENAIGIIMGTGNVGSYLRFEADQTNTFLSRDGGLTWVEAHKGAYIYEFGDHGGLVVMADDIRKTKQVVFSWNEGASWFDFELSDQPLEVDNVVTEPNATSTKFLLYGTRGDSGVMYHLDFEALGQPLCKGVWAADSVSSDYETWSPSDGRGNEKCILGKQVSYTRRKAAAECFNGEKFERPTTKKNCACTEENFECAMGFTRKVGSFECKFADDGTVAIPPTCTSADLFSVVGHRKVIGDSCEGGWKPDLVQVPCPANSKLSKGALSVLGTIFMVAGLMGSITVLSRSEKFRGVFANYGFDQFSAVKYGQIGGRTPETALESCGTRLDSDFIDGDQDDFEDDAPQLMSYGGSRERDRDRDYYREKPVQRRSETASAQVPKLQKPPGSTVIGAGADDDDSLDLL